MRRDRRRIYGISIGRHPDSVNIRGGENPTGWTPGGVMVGGEATA
jgi:hypothetical protein